MTDSRYVIPPAPQATIAVAGSDKVFPVRRIWCVGRNYIEHIREMGQDERRRPSFSPSLRMRSFRTAAPCPIRR